MPKEAEDDADLPEGLVEDDSTKKEQAVMAAIPGMYIDTWHLYTWPGHMRITFGEIFGDVDSYRSAVVMTTRNAEDLARHILSMAERRKGRDESAEGKEDREKE